MKYFLWAVALLILAGIIAVAVGGKGGGGGPKSYAEMTSREIALACTTDMATQFHIHPELAIVINSY